MKNVTILQTVICDTVRQEINGKFILVGVYVDDITFPSIPAFASLALWMPTVFSEKKGFEAEFRVIGEHDQIIARSLKVAIAEPPTENRPYLVILEGVPLQIQSEGPIYFQWRGDSGDWETIKELRVKVAPVLTHLPIASEPPSEQSPPSASSKG